MIIFQHIPKTGGSSLKKIIESQYHPLQIYRIYGVENREVNKSSDWYKQHYYKINPVRRLFLKCIMGHSAGGFIGADIRYHKAFSLLRDPVDRVLSLYYYGLSLHEDTEYKFARIIKDNDLSLDQIFQLEQEQTSINRNDPFSPFHEFYNGQIRAILRPVRHTLKWFDLTPGEKNNAYENEALEKALQLVHQHYVIGFQEKFQESINLFSSKFGWKRNIYVRENVTPDRKTVTELTEKFKSIIETYNSLDIKFYNILFAEFQARL